MEQSRILLVEPSDGTRLALEKSLSANRLFDVACCASPEEAISSCRADQPDVVVLGAGVAASQRPGAVRRLTRSRPPTSLLVLTQRPDLREFLSCVKGGARGYLKAENDVTTLSEALSEICAGGRVIDRNILGDLFAHLAAARPSGARQKPAGAATKALGRLSPRERQVITLMAQGKTNKEIGVLLVTSEGTAKTHVRHILRKLKVSDRTGAVLAVLGIDATKALPPV